MKTFNFDLDTARKILSGEIEGGFVTRDNDPAEVICILDGSKFRGAYTSYPIIAIVLKDGEVRTECYTGDGMFYCDGDESDLDLFITFDRRRKSCIKRENKGYILCPDSKLREILQTLLTKPVLCKIKGKEEEGIQEISGVYRVGEEVYATIGDLDDIVGIDELEIGGEDE